jgi:hypothetical protein
MMALGLVTLTMATARTGSELQRLSDLAAIRRALSTFAPELAEARVGLLDIAELCRRSAVSRPGRDWHDVREQILTVGCEWDLTNDSLEEQPDSCLDCLARFLE